METIKTDIFVGVCYHKPAPVVKTGILQPIHVGAALSDQTLDYALRDDRGRNISEKNKEWCELTAAYWMRHNVDAEYYGLMHYRRLVSFSPALKTDRSFIHVDQSEKQRFGWDDRVIRERMVKIDILTPPVYDTYASGMPDYPMTNYALYARDHYARDLDTCVDVCRSANTEIFPYVLQSLKDRQTRFGNIFVMKRELFFEYCDWMFPVLEETEKHLDTSGYDSYQARVIGFLAERLTEAFFRYAQAARNARVEEGRIAFAAKPPQQANITRALANATQSIEQQPVAAQSLGDRISIAYAIDEGYAKHAATSLHSVLKHAKQPERFEFFVFHKGDMTEESCLHLADIAKPYGARVSFPIVPVETLLWLPMNRAHISMTTYYRLVMDQYLPDHVHRLIYMDADTLATADLDTLWETDMKGMTVAAAPDEGGVLQSRRLRLSTSHKYFNAGILVLDVDQLRQMDLKAEVMSAFEQNGEYITLQDQDLLNIIFENKVAPVDLRWNANNRLYVRNELEPAYSDDEALQAAEDPGVLHFTDSRKPWHLKCYNPFYELYWAHRNQTPWRETSFERTKRQFSRWIWCRLNAKYRRSLSDTHNRNT